MSIIIEIAAVGTGMFLIMLRWMYQSTQDTMHTVQRTVSESAPMTAVVGAIGGVTNKCIDAADMYISKKASSYMAYKEQNKGNISGTAIPEVIDME